MDARRDKDEEAQEVVLPVYQAEAVSPNKQEIFRAHQNAINLLKDSAVTQVGSLQIKSCINGKVKSQALQPLISDKSFPINLDSVRLPVECGASTLKEVIQQACEASKIQIDPTLNSATFTSVVAALAGRPGDADLACSGLTEAEFVPAYYNNKQLSEVSVLALCCYLDGKTALQVDDFKLPARGSITYFNRKAEQHKKSVLKAIEVPDASPITPAIMGEQLQKNACMHVYIEYEFIPDKTLYKTKSFDQRLMLAEKGIRKAKRIEVYAVAGLVLNTQGQELSSAQSQHFIDKMKASSVILNHLCLAFPGVDLKRQQSLEHLFYNAKNIEKIYSKNPRYAYLLLKNFESQLSDFSSGSVSGLAEFRQNWVDGLKFKFRAMFIKQMSALYQTAKKDIPDAFYQEIEKIDQYKKQRQLQLILIEGILEDIKLGRPLSLQQIEQLDRYRLSFHGQQHLDEEPINSLRHKALIGTLTQDEYLTLAHANASYYESRPEVFPRTQLLLCILIKLSFKRPLEQKSSLLSSEQSAATRLTSNTHLLFNSKAEASPVQLINPAADLGQVSNKTSKFPMRFVYE